MAVLRLTWGWGKKAERIGSRQIADMTGTDPRNVRRVLNSLRGKRILMRRRDGKRYARWQIRKDFEQWVAPHPGRINPGTNDPATRVGSTRPGGSDLPASKERKKKEEKSPTNVGGTGPELVLLSQIAAEVLEL
jgi:phage replication O-like protein O